MGPGQNMPPEQCSLSPVSCSHTCNLSTEDRSASEISMPKCCPLPQGGSPLVTLWEVDNPLTSLSLLSEPCLPSHLSVQKGLWVASSATFFTPSCQEAHSLIQLAARLLPFPSTLTSHVTTVSICPVTALAQTACVPPATAPC